MTWAWVAGASEGLGLAFAELLAARGHSLVLIARRGALLEAAAARIEAHHSVRVVVHAADVAADDFAGHLHAWCRETPPAIAVFNAAYAPIGELVGMSETDLVRVIDTNARAPLLFAHILGGHMAAAGSGALILMSSLAGLQGSPNVTAYAATKAFNIVLAEGLWHELRARGVNVHVCCAGAVRTPGYGNASTREAPGTLDAELVARAALDHVGRGPRVTPGWINRVAALVVGRWLPRRLAVATMANATRDLV